jgi:hypothetical protein
MLPDISFVFFSGHFALKTSKKLNERSMNNLSMIRCQGKLHRKTSRFQLLFAAEAGGRKQKSRIR